MVATDVAKSGTAIILSGPGPNFIEVGTGSQTIAVTVTGLATGSFGVASTIDITTEKLLSLTSNFSSVQLSGAVISEFGAQISGARVWNYETFSGITFDGTNEMELEIIFEVF